MKKIITTVGTSLATNDERVKYLLEDIRQETFDITLFDSNGQESSIKREIKDLEHKLYEYILNHPAKASAELSSLDKIDPEGTSEIYLLCTETNLSYVCGRVLYKYLKEEKHRTVKLEYIKDLQVTNAKDFQNEGFLNLIKSVREICENRNDQILFNISGGYKALIPAMTLLAQLEGAYLYYKFEDSEEIIEIGNLPMSFDWEVVETYVSYLNSDKKRSKATDEERAAMRQLKLIKPDSDELTIIGTLLKEYSNNVSPFTNTIFGYFIEHKLYQTFAKVHGPEKVEHSVKLPKESRVDGDIDLLLTPEEDRIITVEIKPSSCLENAPKMKKIKEDLVARTNGVKPIKGKPIESWLIVYSYLDKTDNQKSQDRTLSDNEKALIEDCSETLKNEVDPDIIFRVKHFFIEKNKLGQERHVYQDFMRKTLKIEEIKELFPLQ